MDKTFTLWKFGLKCLVLCLLLTTSSVKTYALNQTTRDYVFTNKPLTSVIESIVKGSSYNIIYTVKDLDNGKLINREIKNATVETALKIILSEQGLAYVIKDKNIIISKSIVKQATQKKIEIIGNVIDAVTKKPIPFATISILGTSHGAITDDNGVFKITVSPGAIIEISFVGMQTQRRNINENDKRVTIELKGDILDVDEVVVTGYQRTTKNRTTGSINIINESELKDAPLRSMDMLMQGKVAGVEVKAVSGRPGETAKIRIRGTNTIKGNAEPLWVVDGIILDKDISVPSASNIRNGDFSTLFANGIAGINPNDIETITILKDASAAAIYGSRAASGVVVVTTKRGKEGQVTVNYSGSLSVTAKPIRSLELMNSEQKLNFENQLWEEFSQKAYMNGDRYPVIGITGLVRSGKGEFQGMSKAEQDAYLESLQKINTNWLDEIFRTSISHNHYLSVSGGTNKSDYYVSLGYGKTNGLVRSNIYDKLSLSSKLGFKLSPKVTLDFNTSLGFQISKDASGNVDLFKYAFYANPYERPFDEKGNFVADKTYFELGRANGNTSYIIPDNGVNVLREIEETEQKVKSLSVTQNISMTYSIFDNLKFEGVGSLSYTNNNSDNINSDKSYAAFQDRPFENDINKSQRRYGSISQLSAYNTSYSLRGQFSYNKEFGLHHNISTLAGSEIRSQYSKSIFEKRYGYDAVTGNSSFPTYPNPSGGLIEYDKLLSYAAIMDGLSGQGIEENAVASFYFSADYSYSNKYTLSFTARTDGSNNFGSKQQFNPVWSIGGLWNIKNEKFLSDKANWLSTLRLRVAGGYTGNINKTVYPQFIMDYDSEFRKTDIEFIRMGAVRSAPNPNLRWERTFDYKVALDAGFFKNRLSIQLEAYNRLSSDVVTQVAVPSSTGFTSQSYNTSKILNQGLELTLSGSVIKKRDYSVTISANASYNNNILKEYISPNGLTYGTNAVNFPLSSIFGGDYQGIDPFTGVYMFKPRKDAVFENKADYLDGDNYLVYLGTNNAPISGGYSLNATYKRLSLSVGGNYSLGAKIMNSFNSPAYYGVITASSASGEKPATIRSDLYVNHLNVPVAAMNRWTENNKITNGYPRLIDAFAPSSEYESYMTTSSMINNGAFLENVSYFKINSLSLSYSLGERFVKRIGLASVGVSFIMNNLLTISNYTGIDPEVPGAIYPQSKSFSMSVNIGF